MTSCGLTECQVKGCEDKCITMQKVVINRCLRDQYASFLQGLSTRISVSYSEAQEKNKKY